jgi:DnaJ-class molecular chaperone
MFYFSDTHERITPKWATCEACGGRGEWHEGRYDAEGDPLEPAELHCDECNGTGEV